MTEILKMIDTEKYLWCKEAALVRVTGGKAALTRIYSEYNEDYRTNSVILLNGKPVVQGEYPGCPTCCALLARGYGIENTGCKELCDIRDRINSGFTDLTDSIRDIGPILGLLEDDLYVIADTELYPTDGTARFFANVPDRPSYAEAACSDYYNCDFIECISGFPAYIYPTQSNSALDPERAVYYLDRIDKENNVNHLSFRE